MSVRTHRISATAGPVAASIERRTSDREIDKALKKTCVGAAAEYTPCANSGGG
jgi:hypothetical protein